jgi:hypothetical protein
MVRATPYFFRDAERSTQQKAETKNKSKREGVSKNEETKEGRGRNQ